MRCSNRLPSLFYLFGLLLLSWSCNDPSNSITKPTLKEYVFQYAEIVPQANGNGCAEGWLPNVLANRNRARGARLEKLKSEVSIDNIKDFSARVHARMKSEYQFIGDTRTRHLERILSDLLAGLPEQEFEFTVYLIEDPDDPDFINAFAALGGNLYMTTAMYDLAEEDAELALVLGHEIGHHVNGHCHKAVTKYDMWDKRLGGRSKLSTLITGLDIIFSKPFNQADELEADLAGLYLCHQGGYSPKKGMIIYKKFSSVTKKTILNRLLRGHPFDDERLECMDAYLTGAEQRAKLENEQAWAIYESQLAASNRFLPFINTFIGDRDPNVLLIPLVLIWFFLYHLLLKRKSGRVLQIIAFISLILGPALYFNTTSIQSYFATNQWNLNNTFSEEMGGGKKVNVEKSAFVRTKENHLALRDGPSIIGTKVLANMPRKAPLFCYYCSKEDIVDGKPGSWCKVRYRNMEGWAWGGYIQLDE